MSFADIISNSETRLDGFRAAIPLDWHQGRTAYGGLSSALALCAACQAGGGVPPLRSAQLAMIGPLAGDVEVRAKVLRRGRNATWVSAEISGKSGIGLTASFVFMGPAESVVHINDCQVPEGLVPVDGAQALSQERGVSFLRNNFEVRFALPRRDEPRAEACWWVRLRERSGIDPMAEALLIGDVLPPGVMPFLPRSTPISTMHWQVNMLTPVPTTRDGWWLLRTTSDYAEQGCSSQRMAMWNADGAPMMAGMQSVALFG